MAKLHIPDEATHGFIRIFDTRPDDDSLRAISAPVVAAEQALTPRWVRRNEDKPHRCPGCHGIALRAWEDRGYGPRTVLRCPGSCRVRWRPGRRQRRLPARTKELTRG